MPNELTHSPDPTARCAPAAPSTSTGSGAAPEDATTRLVVRPWWDPDLAVRGHDPRGAYAERFWLGVIGPSTLFLLRRLARGFETHPGGFAVDVAETARALGLGAGTGRNAPLTRSLDRACAFGLARRRPDGSVEVRTHLPPLARRQVARLPASVRRALEEWPPQGAPAAPGTA